ncbi:endonuclease domain-containing protein [Longimicrobium sp.]|uniref:endonuclease domain-containing protein n=1 Tax=Longimicrobium sp. TaxID=2029185 RepID=UPI002CAED1C4|nr:endonuclease domain-containing protein [Longimicrobium sp.]HSU15946.1 endonuclease domain-containing protein [Longimicrobium sp.]
MRFRHRRIRGTTQELDLAAREMRKASTRAEDVLWQQVRRGALDGYRFRRQHAVGRFVFDLYCRARKLVVEVDGEYHDEEEQRMRDEYRTRALEQSGFKVIRFRNEEVLNDVASVLAKIAAALGPRDPSQRDEAGE